MKKRGETASSHYFWLLLVYFLYILLQRGNSKAWRTLQKRERRSRCRRGRSTSTAFKGTRHMKSLEGFSDQNEENMMKNLRFLNGAATNRWCAAPLASAGSVPRAAASAEHGLQPTGSQSLRYLADLSWAQVDLSSEMLSKSLNMS